MERATRQALLSIRAASVHNLRSLDCDLPLHTSVAVCGPSGSGKSTLLRDVIAGEWNRRIGKAQRSPVADRITGLPPVLYFENRVDRNRRTSVLREAGGAPYLEFLAVSIGTARCTNCEGEIEVHSAPELLKQLTLQPPGAKIIISAPKPGALSADEYFRIAVSRGFSRCSYQGEVVRIDELSPGGEQLFSVAVDLIVKKENDRSRIAEALRISSELNADELEISLDGETRVYPLRPRCKLCGTYYPYMSTELFRSAMGSCSACKGSGGRGGAECAECSGTGLSAYLRGCELFGMPYAELLSSALDALVSKLNSGEANHTRSGGSDLEARALSELRRRLETLLKLGLGYLQPKRLTSTLSSGELQRVKLSRVLSEEIHGALYALDEPTAGLHPKDSENLRSELGRIVSAGNTAVSATNDLNLIADGTSILELGPGSGSKGGRIVFQGTYSELGGANTLTAEALRSPGAASAISSPQIGELSLSLSALHNIEQLKLRLPLGQFICFCGVSGSGKSSLLFQGLAPLIRLALRERATSAKTQLGELTIQGTVLRMEDFQSRPKFLFSRGSVLGLLGLLPLLRELYAALESARIRGLKPREIRLTGNTSELSFKGVPFGEIPSLSIERAAEHFGRLPRIAGALKPAVEFGLGYLLLGQGTGELSQGEEQRLRLSKVFRRRKIESGQIFLLDEPSRGLHPAEQAQLVEILRRIVAAGNTIIAAEHSVILLRGADHIVEMGPGAGKNGGTITAEGSLHVLKSSPRFSLRDYL